MRIKIKPFSSREELAWAAGLFEGEGWISIQKYSPVIGITMCDKDTLERFANCVGGGPIYHRNMRPTPEIQSRKDQWAWRLASFENVQAVLAFMWPWLGARRRKRAKEVLEVAKQGNPRCGTPKGSIRSKATHGDVRKYWQGCRCEECRKAGNIYSRHLSLRWKQEHPNINRRYTRKLIE